jgi:nitroimidazol reductase NimA-like FMN-containing flavoprotein (pyridoxamine 5'-phosphate oxidase superfamily)
MANAKRQPVEPKASRPRMLEYGLLEAPNGAGLIPWRLAVQVLTKSHNYLLATTRPDGRPHCMPVWGVWLDNVFYFSTASSSRKARNLSSNKHCVVCPESVAQTSVIVEGVASEIKDRAALKRIFRIYNAKYDWDTSPDMGPVYAVHPTVAYGIIEFAMQGSATRWEFSDARSPGRPSSRRPGRALFAQGSTATV